VATLFRAFGAAPGYECAEKILQLASHSRPGFDFWNPLERDSAGINVSRAMVSTRATGFFRPQLIGGSRLKAILSQEQGCDFSYQSASSISTEFRVTQQNLRSSAAKQALIAVITLALGIGVNAAIFTLGQRRAFASTAFQ
jgi:hypothetical protein